MQNIRHLCHALCKSWLIPSLKTEKSMSSLQSRDEVVNFVSTNFDYLSTRDFQIIDEVEFSSPIFWAVNFEGKCRIRISWYVRDGMSIMISKSGTAVNEYWN